MARIAVLSALFDGTKGDVRAMRCAVELMRQGHETVLITGTGHPDSFSEDLQEIPPFENGLRRFIPRLSTNMIASIDDVIRPDIVWCHGVAGLWNYVSSATFTSEIQKQILDGASLTEVDWRASKGRAKLIYDAHEWEPDRPGMYPRLRETEDRITREVRGARIADAIVTVSSELARSMDERRLCRRITRVVTNAPFALGRSLETLQVRQTLLAAVGPGPYACFAGSPSPDRDIPLFQAAIAELNRTRQSKIKFIYFGAAKTIPGADAALNLPYPLQVGVEDLNLLDYISACDVAWNGAWTEFMTWSLGAPNKLYEYACAGVPQVAPYDMYVFSRLNAVHKLGATYKGGINQIVTAIEKALSMDRPKAFYNTHNYSSANGETIRSMIEELS